MNNKSLTLCLFLFGVPSLTAGNFVRGDEFRPYKPDAHTLHLYHFDKVEKQVSKDAASKDKTFYLKLTDEAKLVSGSRREFENSLDTRQKLSSRATTSTPLSTKTLWSQETSAFTFEAIVQMDFEPMEILGKRAAQMSIITIDSDGESITRSMNLALRPVGILGAATPSLVFIKYAGPERGPIQIIIADLPIDGPNRVVKNKWFHVAVTYNGDEGKPDNLRLYWTCLDAKPDRAHLLHSASINRDPAKQKSSVLTIGNTARKKNGFSENWVGLIDEVRISGIARKDDEFLFRPEKEPLNEVPKEP